MAKRWTFDPNRDRDYSGLGLALVAITGLITAGVATAETYTLSDRHTVETLETFQECDVCPEMIVLPLGSFTLGAPPDEGKGLDETYHRHVPGGH